MGLEEALASWAEQAGCAEINIQKSNEFARVWIASFTFATALFILATLPVCWCVAAKLRHHDDLPKEEDVEEPAKAKSPRGEKSFSSTLWSADDPTPNLEGAIKHLKSSSPVDGNGEWRSLWGTSVDDLNEVGGIGTELYFRLLRSLGICFIYMSCLTAPVAAFNLAGNFLTDNGQTLVKTTIGNLGWLPTGMDPEDRYTILGCQGISLATLTRYFGWLDFAATLLLLAVLAHFRFIQVPREAALDDLEQITPADYTVEIDGLPRLLQEHPQSEYENLLREHLKARIEEAREQRRNRPNSADVDEQPEGETVRDIVLVRDFHGRLRSVTYRAELLQQKAIAEYKGDKKAVKKLNRKIANISRRLKRALKPDSELPVVRAFVTLNTQQDAALLLHDYRFAEYTLFRVCQRWKRRIEGKAIRVRRAPEPSIILWENQDVTMRERIARFVVMAVIYIIIMAVSLALIYATNVGARATGSSTAAVHTYYGKAECDPRPPSTNLSPYKCFPANAARWTTEEAVRKGGNDLACYCTTVGYSAIVNNSTLLHACDDWLVMGAKNLGMTYAATIVLVVINMLLQATLKALAEFEKPLSVAALNSSKMTKMCIAQIINAGFVILVVNYYPQSDGFRNFINSIPLGNFMFKGDYDSFVPGWFGTVGSTLLSTMLANMFTPAASNLFFAFLNDCCRRRNAKKVKHQAELLQLYTNPPFDFPLQYAAMLVTVFVCVTYSSGMPLMNLFAAGYLVVTYWVDKFRLLRCSKRPPFYDTTMARDASQMMLYAVALHCGFAVVMFSEPCTFPSRSLGGSLASIASLSEQAAAAGGGNQASNWLGHRISRESSWMLAALFIFLVALWVLWLVLWIMGSTFGELLKCLRIVCCGSRRKTQSADHHLTWNWDRARVHIEKHCPPASYSIDHNPEFVLVARFLRSSTTGVESVASSEPSPRAGCCGRICPCFARDEDGDEAETQVDAGSPRSVYVPGKDDQVAPAQGPSPGHQAQAAGARNAETLEAESVRPDCQVQSECLAPVPRSTARGFLQALRAEYVVGEDQAVGRYFDLRVPAAEQALLAEFEEQARAAPDKAQFIAQLAAAWNIQDC